MLQFDAGIPVDPNARLSPLRLRFDRGGIGRDDSEVDFVSSGTDFVIDLDSIAQSRLKLDQPAVGTGLNKPGRVGDDRLFSNRAESSRDGRRLRDTKPRARRPADDCREWSAFPYPTTA